MFSWLSLAIALLKVITNIVSWYKQNQLIEQGYDQAIADETTKILAMTAAGKKILEKVNAMDEKDVDAGLRRLEPSASG
jgi:hypothetical protein